MASNIQRLSADLTLARQQMLPLKHGNHDKLINFLNLVNISGLGLMYPSSIGQQVQLVPHHAKTQKQPNAQVMNSYS